MLTAEILKDMSDDELSKLSTEIWEGIFAAHDAVDKYKEELEAFTKATYEKLYAELRRSDELGEDISMITEETKRRTAMLRAERLKA